MKIRLEKGKARRNEFNGEFSPRKKINKKIIAENGVVGRYLHLWKNFGARFEIAQKIKNGVRELKRVEFMPIKPAIKVEVISFSVNGIVAKRRNSDGRARKRLERPRTVGEEARDA